MRNDFLDFLMPVITRLCDNAEVWIVFALALTAVKKYRGAGISVLLALITCYLAGNMWLKPLFARPRPFYVNTEILLLITPPSDYSFPSGHTMSSFAAATAIFLGNKRMGAVSAILAAVIAFSRMYLYVHYPSDILGGIILGIAAGALAVWAQKAAERLITQSAGERREGKK